MTWLVITASVLVSGGIQSAELRYPVQQFPSAAECEARLKEHNDTGLYDGLVVQQAFTLMAKLTVEFGKHANELHTQLHCEEPASK